MKSKVGKGMRARYGNAREFSFYVSLADLPEGDRYTLLWTILMDFEPKDRTTKSYREYMRALKVVLKTAEAGLHDPRPREPQYPDV